MVFALAGPEDRATLRRLRPAGSPALTFKQASRLLWRAVEPQRIHGTKIGELAERAGPAPARNLKAPHPQALSLREWQRTAIESEGMC
ncbi:hypothetical protein [Metapseudomonas furukawaii]